MCMINSVLSRELNVIGVLWICMKSWMSAKQGCSLPLNAFSKMPITRIDKISSDFVQEERLQCSRQLQVELTLTVQAKSKVKLAQHSRSVYLVNIYSSCDGGARRCLNHVHLYSYAASYEHQQGKLKASLLTCLTVTLR